MDILKKLDKQIEDVTQLESLRELEDGVEYAGHHLYQALDDLTVIEFELQQFENAPVPDDIEFIHFDPEPVTCTKFDSALQNLETQFELLLAQNLTEQRKLDVEKENIESLAMLIKEKQALLSKMDVLVHKQSTIPAIDFLTLKDDVGEVEVAEDQKEEEEEFEEVNEKGKELEEKEEPEEEKEIPDEKEIEDINKEKIDE